LAVVDAAQGEFFGLPSADHREQFGGQFACRIGCVPRWPGCRATL